MPSATPGCGSGEGSPVEGAGGGRETDLESVMKMDGNLDDGREKEGQTDMAMNERQAQ